MVQPDTFTVDPEAFGRRVRVYRMRKRHPDSGKRWTQQDLAAAVGVHYNTVNAWEQGRAVPRDSETILLLADVLEVPIGALLGATGGVAGAEQGAGAQAHEPTSSGTRQAGRLPQKARTWLYEFLAELSELGATEEEIESARRLLTSPDATTFYHGGPGQAESDDDVLEGMKAHAAFIRENIRARAKAR